MDNSEPYDDDPVYLPRVILHATLRGEGTEIYREMSIYEAVALITDVHASHVYTRARIIANGEDLGAWDRTP